jgi:hypothetical protein
MEHQSSLGASFKEKGGSDIWAGRNHQGRKGVLPGLGTVCDADCKVLDESCPDLDEYAAFWWLRLWSN